MSTTAKETRTCSLPLMPGEDEQEQEQEEPKHAKNTKRRWDSTPYLWTEDCTSEFSEDDNPKDEDFLALEKEEKERLAKKPMLTRVHLSRHVLSYVPKEGNVVEAPLDDAEAASSAVAFAVSASEDIVEAEALAAGYDE